MHIATSGGFYVRYRRGAPAMRNSIVIIVSVLSLSPYALAGIRPSFWLSRLGWDATDVVELAITQNEAQFRVLGSVKGGAPPGTVKTFSKLVPPPNDHTLLRDLASRWCLAPMIPAVMGMPRPFEKSTA